MGRDVTSPHKNLVKIKNTNFLRPAIQEPMFCVDGKQTMAVTMGMVLAIAQKLKSTSNPATGKILFASAAVPCQ
jgi:hypothetical protein